MPLLSIAKWNVFPTAGLVYTKANTAMLKLTVEHVVESVSLHSSPAQD